MPGIHGTLIMKEIWKNWKKKIMIFYLLSQRKMWKNISICSKGPITDFFIILGHSMSNWYICMTTRNICISILKYWLHTLLLLKPLHVINEFEQLQKLQILLSHKFFLVFGHQTWLRQIPMNNLLLRIFRSRYFVTHWTVIQAYAYSFCFIRNGPTSLFYYVLLITRCL